MFKHLKRYTQHFLLTWHLWKLLLQPPEHPVFRRTIKTASQYKIPLPVIWFALIVASVSCYSLWAFLLNFNVSIAVLLPLTMMLFSCTYVVLWISNITLTLMQEQEQRTYDTMSISPLGALGANWAICTAILHRHDALTWLDFLRRLLSGLVLLILLMVLVTISFKVEATNSWQPLALLLDILALSLMSYIDHVHSIVLGSLIALLVPQYIRNGHDMHIWAVFLFITLQAFAFLGFLSLMLLMQHLVSHNYSFITLGLLLFYILREVMICTGWYVLAYHLNSSLAELENQP